MTEHDPVMQNPGFHIDDNRMIYHAKLTSETAPPTHCKHTLQV